MGIILGLLIYNSFSSVVFKNNETSEIAFPSFMTACIFVMGIISMIFMPLILTSALIGSYFIVRVIFLSKNTYREQVYLLVDFLMNI